MSTGKVQTILNHAAAVSVIAASASVVWLVASVRFGNSRTEAQSAPRPTARIAIPSGPISIDGAAILGRLDARFGVIAYSDFQCPYCARFADQTLPKIVKEYVEPGNLFFGFRHLPLERIHPAALRAAQAAECGRRQGKFWQMHDLLFASTQMLGTLELGTLAAKAHLDGGKFTKCLAADSADAIRRDQSKAAELGITGTPTFLFGVLDANGAFRVTRVETGAIPFAAFAGIAKELIAGVPAGQPGAQ